MKYVAKLPDSSVNASPESPIRELVRLLLALAAIVVAIFILLGWAVDKVVPYVSPAFEQRIGELFFESIENVSSDDHRQPYLQQLTQQLVDSCQALPYDIQVAVVADKSVNAVALPGGRILLFSGLLEKVDSENELAFVIGHELGHFVQKDHLRALGRNLVVLTISMSLFGADSRISNMFSQSLQLSQIGYSRGQESGADSLGLFSLRCRYGHVNGATDFFEKLQEAHPHGSFETFISTHPAHDKRIADINALIARKKWHFQEKVALPADFRH